VPLAVRDYVFAKDDFKTMFGERNGAWRTTPLRGRPEDGAATVPRAQSPETYPSCPRIGVLAIEASLAIGDTGAGAARVEALGKRNLSAADRDALNVMRGYLQKLSGDVDGAVATWREMAGSADRKNQARARYALTNALLERKEISVGDAIERMERLRYAWRGDVHEFDLLRRLAQLYTDRGDNRIFRRSRKRLFPRNRRCRLSRRMHDHVPPPVRRRGRGSTFVGDGARAIRRIP
jgi:hypothetical protein